ncbi:hypothetical protein RchiOBHm_Chr4g0411241 [Rosa chinensis]|uniref:Uncharacterized protein n=1 Tax=Rosa chinensis TaxID=74649 RepID=A0A2P6QVM1_ROSCH|nr:hypothetical protein RchiOBHm_Chr4g0411241 [Rosa chinensis]
MKSLEALKARQNHTDILLLKLMCYPPKTDDWSKLQKSTSCKLSLKAYGTSRKTCMYSNLF